jgi:hypothetical protein
MTRKADDPRAVEEALRTGRIVSVEPLAGSSRIAHGRGEPAAYIPPVLANQVIGNVGLYYVCYRLSLRGWNVMPTSRNAKGIDVLIYSQDALRTRTIQVKALSKPNPVPLGSSLANLFGDFFIICRNAVAHQPECFVLEPAEVRALAHRGVKHEKVSYWLQPKAYAVDKYREAWHRVGSGLSTPAGTPPNNEMQRTSHG